MKALRRFVKRLTASLFGHRDDDRVREELAEHLELATEEFVRAGVPLEDARRRARRCGGRLPASWSRTGSFIWSDSIRTLVRAGK